MPPRKTVKQRLVGLAGPDGRKRARSPSPNPPEERLANESLLQRLKRDSGAQSSQGEATPLYATLRKRWASASLPSNQVQEYADAAQSSGASGVGSLQKIGAGGKHKQNAMRDIMRVLGRPRGSPEFYKVAIPVSDGEGGHTIVEHPFILPHQLFGSVFHERPDDFIRCIQGDNRERAQFWEQIQTLPLVKEHPIVSQSSLEHTIPIGIHGDAGKFSHQDSLFVLTWNGLLGRGPTIEQRFVITVVRKKQLLASGATLNAIFKVISWSFNCMAEGLHPIEDEDGNALPGGAKRTALAGPWRAICCQVRGDWQFYCQSFGFPQWNSAGNCCWLCRASATDQGLLWTDFNRDAGWRSTCWDHKSYLSHLDDSGADVPELFNIRGLRLETIAIDVLHCVDLGVAQHVIGNTLWEALPYLGRNKRNQLDELNRRLKRWYSAHKVESRLQGQLVEDMLKSAGGWPKLRAKGAATRNMAAFAQCLAREFASGSERDARKCAVNDALVEFYQILQQEGRFFSKHAQRRMPKIAEELCGLYSCLSAEAVHLEKRAWKLVPKFHLFVHLLQSQCLHYGNPRFCWCYSDEDMVGQMVEVARSCHPKTMAATALYKYLVLMFDE